MYRAIFGTTKLIPKIISLIESDIGIIRIIGTYFVFIKFQVRLWNEGKKLVKFSPINECQSYTLLFINNYNKTTNRDTKLISGQNNSV